MSIDKCWYQQICNKYNTTQCNTNCIRYSEMNYLIQSSNLPKR